MKYGLYLPNFEPYGKARLIAELANEAEAAGWDGLFMWDDIANPDAEMVDPWVALAAVAMRTTRLQLGALITPLARRRPWKFARETVTLDHLSEGRLVVGIGAGTGGPHWEMFGDENQARKRGEMLDEAMQIVTGLWRGETYHFQGKHYQLKETRFLPAAYQKPRIPIWVGGVWPNPRPLRRMAQWDGMFPLFFGAASQQEALQQFTEAVQTVKAMRTTDTPFDVITLGVTAPDQPEESAQRVRAYAAAGATWWLEAIEPMRLDYASPEKQWSFEQLRSRVLAGPPRI